VKWRIDAVLKTVEMVGTGQHYLANLPAAEFCLLQLRMVCELVALGCIAIHTDVPQTARLQKLWNEGAIIDDLKKLKPTYFPIPAKNVGDENGVIYFNVRLDDLGLNSSELLKMYILWLAPPCGYIQSPQQAHTKVLRL
jgi:hypothetical protein